jgi:pilus assembly protein CpaB
MDKRKLMLLVGALVIAIGTALAARSLMGGGGSPQAVAAAKVEVGTKVLVAQRALPVGTIITADAIGFKAWPKEMVQDAYFLEGEADMQKMLGTVVRNPITAGEPITQGSLVAPGDRGFLAAALGPGMRAVTIPVSARTGVAGFVFPGDHIDLVLTQSVKGNDSQPLKASETIIRNLRVLATDQSATQEQVEGKTKVKAFSTVTVEVTPKLAEKIAVAQTIGQISLSLRSLADNSAELEQAIASGDVKVPAGATPQDEEKLLKQALAHPLDGGTSFVTGGDVSRFQRKSMPALGAANPGMAPPPAPAPGPVMAGPAAPPRPRGPVINITRGKDTVTVSVGGAH